MKRFGILVIAITFFCAIYAAVTPAHNVDTAKRFDFYAKPSGLVDSTLIAADTIVVSADTVAVVIDSTAVPADTLSLPADSVKVVAASLAFVAVPADTLSLHADSVKVVADSIAVSADSVRVVADSLAFVAVPADTLSLSADSVKVVADSLAFVAVPADTLSLPADSVKAAADSIPVSADSIKVVADSLAFVAVPADTLSLPADSLAVDSAALKSTVPDSLLIGYMPKVLELKYFQPTELSQNELDALRTLYKRECREKLKVTPPGELYDIWKLLFTSTPEKTLDLYVDGVAIIQSKIEIDTILHKRYDRMLEYRDELMELYDMAVGDIDRLNSQIDRTKSKDTLSVAKLRARQVYSYLEITVDYREFTVDTMPGDGGWRQYMLNKDRDVATFAYPRYREMLKCNDLNIDMIHLYYFAVLANNKVIYDKAVGLSVKELKENLINDKSLLLQRADSILNAPNLNLEALYKTSDKTVRETYTATRNNIEGAMRQAEEYFISQSDHAALEKHYMERYKKGEGNDPAFWEIVLNSGLKSDLKSEVYYLVLEQKYKSEYTIDLAISLVKRAISMKNLLKDNGAQHYCEEIFNMPDFYYLSVEDQVNIYMYAVVIYAEIAKKTPSHKLAKSFEYTDEVRKLCPQHPAPDFYDAVRLELMKNIFTKSGYIQDAVQGKIFYCLIDDMYSESRKKLDIFNETMQGSNILPVVKESNLKSQKQYFPKHEEVFMNGYNAGDKFTFDFGRYGKYTTTIRTSN